MDRDFTEMKKAVETVFYHQWLQSMQYLSARYAGRLIQLYPCPEKLLSVDPEKLKELLPAAQFQELADRMRKTGSVREMREEYERLSEKGIGFVSIQEEAYPRRLLDIPDPPVGLYYRGRLPDKDTLSVAVIGSRECSEYGSYVARELGAFLGRRGIHVISGMARGIDGISQLAALEAGGTSYGILGCGADVCYPLSNRRLYESLSVRGGLLSTYPPGTSAVGRNFPARNRIVSGLADAVVVVEARVKSGTLITVDMALEQGREVYVVPGRVTDRLSDGCNRLIKQGASVFLSPESFLEELEELAFLKKIAPGNETPKGAVKEKKTGDGGHPAGGDPNVTAEKRESGAARRRQQNNRQENRGSKGAGFGNGDTEAFGRPAPAGMAPELLIIWEKLDHTPKALEEVGRALEDRYTTAELGVLLMKLVMTGRAKQVTAGYFCRQ